MFGHKMCHAEYPMPVSGLGGIKVFASFSGGFRFVMWTWTSLIMTYQLLLSMPMFPRGRAFAFS